LLGYRYYETAETEEIGYKFGHGLTYSNFEYSGLNISEGTVSFTLKNTGNRAATELVQMYVGKNDSAVIRPKKELCSYKKISLEAGQSANVELELIFPKVYDEIRKIALTEKGTYTVYIGASVGDIRLTKQTAKADGEVIEADGFERSDYIQSETNIFTKNFKLEAEYKPMKKTVLNITAGAVALVFAICLKLYCVYADLDARFFDIFSLLLAAGGMVFFIIEAINRNTTDVAERAELDKRADEMFENAEQIPVYSADKMFLTDFSVAETSEEEETVTEETDGNKYIDYDLTFETAAKDFEKYAQERGYVFRSETVRGLFASLSSSRMLIVNGLNSESFKEFMMLLSGYFGTATYIDKTDSTYKSVDSIFYNRDANGDRVKTQVGAVFNSAKNARHQIHFAGLDEVTFENLPAYFSAFADYIKAPSDTHKISAYNIQLAEMTYTVPKNLWFVLNLAEGEAVSNVHNFASELGVFNTVYFEKAQPSDTVSEYSEFSFYQMEYLAEKALMKAVIEEENWKKIDALVEYMNGFVPYSISNRKWISIENYIFTYMACGGEELEALDHSVASRLIADMLSSVKDKLTNDDKTLMEACEEIFGEEHTEACKRTARISGAQSVVS